MAEVVPSCRSAPFSAVCQSLALFYINVATGEQLKVSDFVKPFLPLSGQSPMLYDYYFKVMEEIAASLSNERVVLDDSLRIVVRQQVESQQAEVMFLLEEHCDLAWSQPEIDKDVIFECLASWAEISHDALEQLPSHRVMQRLIETL